MIDDSSRYKYHDSITIMILIITTIVAYFFDKELANYFLSNNSN